MGAEIDLIKERLSIADIVGEYTQLRPAGQNLKALCPFHSEKTPSFIVSPKRGTWHCFGACSEGGDIFTFVQKAEGIDFPAALVLLAERAGVDLPKRNMGQQTSNHRQRIFEALETAVAFYHEILMNQEAGGRAKEYLMSRGVTEQTMKDFRIGYAPSAWDVLQRAWRRKGFNEREMLETGLVGRSERGKFFDRFRGRIMFPVHDSRGRVVAFGGRIVPWHETGNEGKYINSPETALYEKRSTVFNVHRAKEFLRKGMPCLVVEGYMDAIMLTQAGAKNVVATSGTAFTEGHVAMLSRYTDTLHFAFDADAAGFKATVAATQAALLAGMKVGTIIVTGGKDPADMVQESAKGALVAMERVQPLTMVLIHQLQTSTSLDGREQQLNALLPLIQLVKNPIQQGKMVEEVAETLHVPAGRVIERMQESRQPAPYPSQAEAQPQHMAGVTTAERQMLGILIAYQEARQALFSYLEPELFLDGECLALYKSMQQLAEGSPTFSSMQSDAIIDALAERQRSFAEGVRALAEEKLATAGQDVLHEGRALVRTLKRRSLRSSLERLQQEVAMGENQERSVALERFKALSQELASIDNF